jgi:hypothetical protein
MEKSADYYQGTVTVSNGLFLVVSYATRQYYVRLVVEEFRNIK